jgi:hypothetical protein
VRFLSTNEILPLQVISRAEEMAAKFEKESSLAQVSRVRTTERAVAEVIAAFASTPATLLALKEKLVRVQNGLAKK